jgi:stage V sporulation protein AA
VNDAIQEQNMIQTKFPELDVRVLGPLYTIIETETPRSRLPKKIFVLIIAIFLFTGSGLAIMNFHTEVNMKRVHERIYFIVTGHKSSNLLLLQIPYSIGIGVGMVLFLNHVFKRRFNEEPSPMELEMFQYQEMIDQYVIEHEKLGMEDHKHDHSDSDST